MKRRIIISFSLFFIANFIICVLSKNYSYFAVLEMFDFFDESGFVNLTFLIFNSSYVSVNIILMNSLIEEKTQISKYIQVRSGRKNATYRHILRLITEFSLIVISKIISDFIIWFLFDRKNYIYIVCYSLLIYITELLWLLLFDCLSNFNVKNNILVVFMISLICLSYVLLKYNNLFSLIIIKTCSIDISFFKIIAYKIIILLLILSIDIFVRLKKEYY